MLITARRRRAIFWGLIGFSLAGFLSLLAHTQPARGGVPQGPLPAINADAAPWSEAAERTQPVGQLSSLQHQIEQAQVLGTLGKHQRAIDQSQGVLDALKHHPNPLLEAAAQGIIGNAHWALGNYQQALSSHQQSLRLAPDQPLYQATAWGNIANVWSSQASRHRYQQQVALAEGDTPEIRRLQALVQADQQAAQNAYLASIQASRNLGGMTEIQARLNFYRFLKTEKLAAPMDNRDRVLTLLQATPNSREKVFALINLATTLQEESSTADQELARSLLLQAVQLSGSDQRALSFAQGALGHLSEINGDLETALRLTRQAQQAAGAANDSLYQWFWQSGRILKAQKQPDAALLSYRQAIATLQTIRSDILVANKGFQFDLRDSVEPLYRETIDLLVPTVGESATQKQLQDALDTLELLKLTELQNFFGDDCAQVTRSTAQPQVPADTVVLYSVILDRRLVWILRSPTGQLQSISVAMGAQDLKAEVTDLRYALEDIALESYIERANQVYRHLIEPIRPTLEALSPKTLVFINDGVLRNVPMAALYDGQDFLVQKFAIANALSLTLTEHSKASAQPAKALIFGLTEARPPFNALPSVARETERVQNIVGGQQWLDQAFTVASFTEKVRRSRSSILHLATHAKFGVDGNSTFLLAHDQRLTLDQIEVSLRDRTSPVDLLTLSACQTAAGDNRAALGLAGAAVRAGVRSTLASLWFINDADTVPLIESFYTQLEQPERTKAEALQSAQTEMIANPLTRHPALWSSLVLIGDWR
jgi:CHAT domain-containing protein